MVHTWEFSRIMNEESYSRTNADKMVMYTTIAENTVF
jgi:hypothetical protein